MDWKRNVPTSSKAESFDTIFGIKRGGSFDQLNRSAEHDLEQKAEGVVRTAKENTSQVPSPMAVRTFAAHTRDST
jgi:hypothetical protein